jgi:uncharacterized protein (TIGR03118 family)
MNRRDLLNRALWATAGLAATPWITACGGGGSEPVSANNRYRQSNLVANNAAYNPLIIEPDLIDAWGIAIRPAGAGGHFWVTATAGSFEYVGDVNGTPLSQDALTLVDLPASTGTPPSGDPVGAANGVVFNGGSHFVITQAHANGAITAAAKFIFVSDNGVLSAWTERSLGGGLFDRPTEALPVVDYSADGSSFFGLAINPAQDKLFVVDFGNNPGPSGGPHPKIRIFDSTFTEEALAGRFTNPFVAAGGFQVGDLVPFNIQALTYSGRTSVFVAYVNTGVDANGNLTVAVESSGRGRGRLVEYTADGQLIAVWDDRGVLNGPWGMVVAPANFGAFSNQLIVGNFSDGTMVGFDTTTRRATEYVRDSAGGVLKIAGLWGLLFGNGASLGDSHALYFAAGVQEDPTRPAYTDSNGDEQNGVESGGLFGSLRLAV